MGLLRAACLASALTASLTLAGCSGSVSVGGGSVDQADLEQQVSDQLEAQVGQAPDDVSCPGDLDAEVGTTMRCTLTAGGEEIGLTVEVTEVKDSTVLFDITVDDAPSS